MQLYPEQRHSANVPHNPIYSSSPSLPDQEIKNKTRCNHYHH